MDWHKGRCFPKQNFIKESHPDDCMITYDDPGDENDQLCMLYDVAV